MYLMYCFVHIFLMVQFYLIGKTGVSYNYHSKISGFSLTAGGLMGLFFLIECFTGLYFIIKQTEQWGKFNDNWNGFFNTHYAGKYRLIQTIISINLIFFHIIGMREYFKYVRVDKKTSRLACANIVLSMITLILAITLSILTYYPLAYLESQYLEIVYFTIVVLIMQNLTRTMIFSNNPLNDQNTTLVGVANSRTLSSQASVLSPSGILNQTDSGDLNTSLGA